MSRKIIYAVYNFYYSYKYKHLFSYITDNEISDLFLLGVRIWVNAQGGYIYGKTWRKH